MTPLPVITAVIPTYNNAAFIQQAVASINAQTRPVDEIIIVDDGSTDNTAEIVNDLEGDIRYLRQGNQGPSAARNNGVQAAHGDMIAFLDADDQWTPEKIEHQLAVMQQYEQLVMVAGDMAEINLQDEVIVPSVLGKHSMHEVFTDLAGAPVQNALSLLMKINFIPTGTVLVKRSTLLDAGGFNADIRYGEDLELWARIAASGEIACLPEVLMLRRQHGRNATRSLGPLLEDLVKVTLSVRSWGAEYLHQQGSDPDLLVAEAMNNLGYWQFSSGQLATAQQTFMNSLREKTTLRALLYRSLCIMPASLVYTLRKIKQRVSGTR
jgi:glycosyltransferase involved in cell wall biosynthesis